MPGCAKRDATPPDRVLRISQRNEPATLDPQRATLPDEFFIIRALGEGLLTPNPEGGMPLPGAAEKWEMSPDGLTYTFHLRADARWSNGDAVTARDFVETIERALTPATAAPKAALFFPVKNAEPYYLGREKSFGSVQVGAPDTHILQVTLARPTADFPAIVASGPWIPIHGGKADGSLGNGPFTLVEWRPHQHITVRKNPLYWNAAAVRLDGIRFAGFDNGDSEERAFRADQLDVTMAVPFSKLAAYRTAQPAVLRTIPLHETRYLALNVRRPPLNDARVRRALSLALHRAQLTERVLQGGQQPAFNFVSAGLGGYPPAARLTEDAAEARRLLAEAGFPEGRGFPRLELATWVNTPVLEAVQQMWQRELGVEVAIAQREARTHLSSLASGDYAIALMTAIPDYDGASDAFGLLTSGNPGNYPHWSSAEYDRLVGEAGRADLAATRNATYQRAEQIILEEMPLIPLYFNTQNFLLQPRVKHWQTDRLWTRFYAPVSIE